MPFLQLTSQNLNLLPAMLVLRKEKGEVDTQQASGEITRSEDMKELILIPRIDRKGGKKDR
jgi:hypothetical protein